MSHIHSFPPIEDSAASVLILGSMPGKESLRAGQYYAHRRNAFWPIMGDLTGAAPVLPYESRTRILKAAGIALWDVLASCARGSSMDSDIDEASIRPNDFVPFFLAHPDITDVFFNGAMAEKCFRKFVRPLLEHRPLHYRRLPSTSPANATMSYEQKLKTWEIAIRKSVARIENLGDTNKGASENSAASGNQPTFPVPSASLIYLRKK
ncbi:MAG: DNA-deoxyinosine glycosylase [Gallionella sp.]|nr:MAG: DNA-deoxyinosine glycosylase [Gallionella sp.]